MFCVLRISLVLCKISVACQDETRTASSPTTYKHRDGSSFWVTVNYKKVAYMFSLKRCSRLIIDAQLDLLSQHEGFNRGGEFQISVANEESTRID